MSSKGSPKPEAPNNTKDTSKAADAAVSESTEAGQSEDAIERHHQHQHQHHDAHKRHSSRKLNHDDLSTWTHISMDRSGATLRTVSTANDDRSSSERRYPHIPRVDEPVEVITHEKLKAMEDQDGKAESEDEDEDGWVLVEK